MPTVYVTRKIPDVGLQLLKKKHFRVDLNHSDQNLSEEDLKKLVSKYDAIITLVTDKIDRQILAQASPNLKIISNFGVGYDNIDILEAKRKGVIVTNTPGAASESVAEHVFMLFLSCLKQVIAADRFVRLGKYKKWDPFGFISPQMWGKNIGIIGLGKIGTFVGNIAYNGFKMDILYYDTSRSEDFEILTEAKYSDMELIFKKADFITLHVPLTPQTFHLVGKKQLDFMKNSAILVNTSRGAVIDEEALVEALKTQKIAAAGLDVYEHEPDISQDLIALENAVLTPHSASATIETRNSMSRIAAENIIDVFEGKEPFGLIKAK